MVDQSVTLVKETFDTGSDKYWALTPSILCVCVCDELS